MQSRDIKGSVTEGWSSETCARMAGGIKSERTVFRYWDEWEQSLGRSMPADFVGPRPMWDVNDCNGKGTFQMDHRGKYERDWILSEEDYLFQFKREMKGNLKKLSVDHMTHIPLVQTTTVFHGGPRRGGAAKNYQPHRQSN